MALPSYEKRVNEFKKISETTLYESDTFRSTGTLSDSIMNYERIKIYATSSDSQCIDREIIKSQYSNGTYTSFWAGSIPDDYSHYYAKTARMHIKDNAFTLDRVTALDISSGSLGVTKNANTFVINKIVGYKY